VRTVAKALNEADLRELALRYRISPEVRSAAGIVGLKQGRESGASVEIQDYRDYVPGDDPRRIDWLAYGRTDRLVVRLFREEVSPFFDVLVDTSASMAVADGRKAALSAELCGWLYHSALASGLAVRLFAAGEQLSRVAGPAEIAFDQADSVLFTDPQRATADLRRSSVRLLLTDFMHEAAPADVLRPLSAGCRALVLVQLLGPWEADPSPEGPAVLRWTERGVECDLHLDARAVRNYRRRLEAQKAAIRDEVFRCGGQLVTVVADRQLEEVLRDDFLPAGLLEVYGA